MMTKHKLMTKELEKKFPKLGSQEKVEDPIVITKFFHPYSSWEWYPIEYDPEERLFFGLVKGFDEELGYFSLDELESVTVKGLPLERDLYFKPVPLSKVRGQDEKMCDASVSPFNISSELEKNRKVLLKSYIDEFLFFLKSCVEEMNFSFKAIQNFQKEMNDREKVLIGNDLDMLVMDTRRNVSKIDAFRKESVEKLGKMKERLILDVT